MKKSTIEAMDLALEELLALKQEVKDKTEQIERIQNWCKEQGSFSTGKFIVAVVTRERVGIAPLPEVEKVVDRRLLEEFGLIRKSEFQVVNVARLAPGFKDAGA